MTIHRHAAVVLALLSLAMPACEQGLKVGDKQVIKGGGPLIASSLIVTRRQGVDVTTSRNSAATQPAEQRGSQKLEINLDNGRATLTDTDGRTYQGQVRAEELASIRSQIADRSWRIGRHGAPQATASASQYTLTVYHGDRAYGDQPVWTSPSRDKLPKLFTTLEDVFDRTQRLARPMSGGVNLLD
jgi:hypothetical protein